MTIRSFLVHKQSAFLGQECALCKHPFAPGEEIVVCPADGSRHHTLCWQANNNRCTAYGCTGAGELASSASAARERDQETGQADSGQRRSRIKVLPSQSVGCAQSCLLISIAVALLLFAVGCFGLWAILDYVLLEWLGWTYRAPLGGILPLIPLLHAF